eukprot:6185097-Prymnesium_polylepis.1
MAMRIGARVHGHSRYPHLWPFDTVAILLISCLPDSTIRVMALACGVRLRCSERADAGGVVVVEGQGREFGRVPRPRVHDHLIIESDAARWLRECDRALWWCGVVPSPWVID